ncbi:MAG TPA: ion channel [Candidatus Binatia bacterium]|jgi:inward rectifier potassium channel|nr:ion channel [Candidatus Binatia bacterium]
MATETTTRPLSDQDLRDLGFGAVVSRESQQRLLNRDGSFNVERKGLSFWSSFSAYHAMLTMPWWEFFGIAAVMYFVINALFAAAYVACGPDALSGLLGNDTVGMERHPYLRAFFFSVQTVSTIGYGHIVPVGTAANTIVAIEALVGLFGFAIVTGLLFARFARPTAKMLFSSYALIAPYQNITAFEFRVANPRSNELIEVSAKVLLSRFEDVDGSRTRRYYPLPLERPGVVFLPLTWTVVHPIDEKSPLFGETAESLKAIHAEFLVLLSAFDETFSTTVHTRTSYVTEEVKWGYRFANAFVATRGRRNKVAVDMRQFDRFERATPSLER